MTHRSAQSERWNLVVAIWWFWDGFSDNATGILEIIDDRMNSKIYQDDLDANFLGSVVKLGLGNERVLQQDNNL